MLDRIEVRRSEGEEDERVAVAIAGQVAVFQIWRDAVTFSHSVSSEVLSSVLAQLERAAVPPIGDQEPRGVPVGYEVTLTAGMSQSVFRWVASTPTGWEPVADAAHELIALARTFAATTPRSQV